MFVQSTSSKLKETFVTAMGKFAFVKQETLAYAGKEKDRGYEPKMH